MSTGQEPFSNSAAKPETSSDLAWKDSADAPAIPDHKLIRCVGSGSYGEVWLALNYVGSYRAVKIVRRDSFKSEKPFERELSGICKFEPISRSHEGFIHVLHIGSDPTAAWFYYIMEAADDQVSGQSIDPERYTAKSLASELEARKRLSFEETVQLGLALAKALAELHRRGLVHRDVKPSNILFVNGRPKLGDIGLVADVQNARSYVGTEGFIPPEGPGTQKADVYSLGKVLYEASTGRDRQDFPALPTIWEDLPEHDGLVELNEVIVRACHGEPDKRYESAAEMYEELSLLAAGKSVRRLRVLERRWKTVKRLLGVAAAILAVLAIIFRELYREWQVAGNLRQQRIGASVAYGNRAMDAGDLLGSLPYFADAIAASENEPNGKAALLRFNSVLSQCPKVTHMWFHRNQITSVGFSPDGNSVLVAESYGKARVYRLPKGELQAELSEPGDALSGACFSPDGNLVLTASQNGFAQVWDFRNLKEIRRLPHPGRVYSGAFSPDGREFVTCCEDGRTRVWNLHGSTPRLTLEGHSGPVMAAAFNNDGRWIATCGRDGTARLWQAADGVATGLIIRQGRWVMSVAFSPDSKLLIVGSDDHRATVWELSTGRRILPDLSHGDMVRTVQFSPDGNRILTASLDGTARLWSRDNQQPFDSAPVLPHQRRVSCAAFDADGRRVVVGSPDGSVRLWDLACSRVAPVPIKCQFDSEANRYIRFDADQFQVYDLTNSNPLLGPLKSENATSPQLTRDGRFLYFVRASVNLEVTDRAVEIWNVDERKHHEPDMSLSKQFSGICLSDDGKLLVSYGGKTAQLWDVDKAVPMGSPLTVEAPISSLAFSRHGKSIALAAGTRVSVYEVHNGHPRYPALLHARPVEVMDFSRDDHWLITGCSDSTLTNCYGRIWDAEKGQSIGSTLNHDDGVLSACFSPDAKHAATSSEDFTARVWDATTGKPIGQPLRHNERVQSISFSPDSQWVVTASGDRSARIWETSSGDPLTPPLKHFRPLFGARFLPDGHTIFATDTRQCWIWSLPMDSRPTEDIVALGNVLSGGNANSLRELWARLRARYPHDLNVTPEQIEAWHQHQAQQNELNEDWFAAVFHLERLQRLRPQDTSVLDRLQQNRERLANASKR